MKSSPTRLKTRSWSSIRRVVKTPRRWNRIVELAAQTGDVLPEEPDSSALNEYLTRRRNADPDHFPDLSLAVIKLHGSGRICSGKAGAGLRWSLRPRCPGLYALNGAKQALRGPGYAAVVEGSDPQRPATVHRSRNYSRIATNCTLREDQSRKVEREMQKRVGRRCHERTPRRDIQRRSDGRK